MFNKYVSSNTGGYYPLAAVLKASPAVPRVQTISASSLTSTTAQLSAIVDPNGLNTTYYFQYGPTAIYGQSTSLRALTPGEVGYLRMFLYHRWAQAKRSLPLSHRSVAFNSDGLVTGNDLTLQTLDLSQPDLIVENLTSSPLSVVVGTSFTMSFRIRNRGTAACIATLARLRISLDTNLTPSDPLLSPSDTAIPVIVAGGYYDYSGTIMVPLMTPPGRYYVGVFADADNRAGQSDISNDRGVTASALNVTANAEPK